MARVRRHFLIEGRVQGWKLSPFCCGESALPVTNRLGPNLPNGAVEVQAQGEEDHVLEMEKWSPARSIRRQGSRVRLLKGLWKEKKPPLRSAIFNYFPRRSAQIMENLLFVLLSQLQIFHIQKTALPCPGDPGFPFFSAALNLSGFFPEIPLLQPLMVQQHCHRLVRRAECQPYIRPFSSIFLSGTFIVSFGMLASFHCQRFPCTS